MSSEIYIHDFSKVVLKYEIPEHLYRIESAEEQKKADLELLDNELRKRGSSLEEKLSSGVIWRGGFPGMILDVQKIELSGCVNMTVKPIHPYRADLAYKLDKTLPKNVSPLTVNGLLESSEGIFVLGIRGGLVETGKIAIIPGGHVDYTDPPIENILETFGNELKEEIGYEFDGKVSPVCVFTNKDTNGINVLYKAKTDLDFSKIEKSWRTTKDKYEHDLLFKASYQMIEQLAVTGETIVDGRKYSATSFQQDCFRLSLGDTLG